MEGRPAGGRVAAGSLALVLLCLGGRTAQAEQTLSLQAFEERVLARSPHLAALDQELKAARFEALEGEGQYWPDLALAARYWPELGGPEAATFRASLDFRIVDFLLRRPHEIDEREALILMLRASRRIRMLDELLELRQLFAEALYAQRTEPLMTEVVALLRWRRERTTGLVAEQVALPQALMAVEGRLLEAQERLLALQLRRRELGRVMAERSGWQEASRARLAVPAPVTLLPPVEALRKVALVHRWDLRQQLAQVKVRRAQLAQSTLAYTDVRVGTRLTMSSGRQIDVPGLSLGVNLNVPLSVVSRSRARSGALEAKARAAAIRSRELRRAIEGEVAEAARVLASRMGDLEVARKGRVLAGERARVAELRASAHLSGARMTGAEGLSQAKIDLHSAEIAVEERRLALFKAQFELLHALGVAEFPRDALLTEGQGESAEAAARAQRHPRDLWLWREEDLAQEMPRRQLLAFLRGRGVERVYLSLGAKRAASLLAGEGGAFLEGLRQLRRTGTRLGALIGDPGWITKDGRERLAARVRVVLAHNGKRPEVAFDEVHLDIEPHTLPAYRGNTDFLRPLAEAVEVGRAALNAAEGARPALAVDLPRKALEGPPSELRRIFLAADRVVPMLYGISPAKRRTAVRAFLKAAPAGGAKVKVGLRASDYSAGGEAEMEGEIADLFAAFAKGRDFAGVAVHDYVAYRELVLAGPTSRPAGAP